MSTLAPPSFHPTAGDAVAWPRWLQLTWTGFVLAGLLLLEVVSLQLWATVIGVAAVLLVAGSAARFRAGPWAAVRVDRWDLTAVAVLYVAVVALFRLAFVGFTQANVVGLFLSFAAGLPAGTAGPIAYTTWVRHRPLSTLGLGLHRLPATVARATSAPRSHAPPSPATIGDMSDLVTPSGPRT